MKPLLDGDIIRYEIGYAAEAGWKYLQQDEEALPPFDFVEATLMARLAQIEMAVGATQPSKIFITEGHTFRYDIATTKPYKGTRKDKKPWHFDNLTLYLTDVLDAEVVTGIEADDAMAIVQTKHRMFKEHDLIPGTIEYDNCADTIICTRDKDLRQVPGWIYSWELHLQPEFGPELIDLEGSIELSEKRDKIKGTGLTFFYSQLLTGDTADNIPGLPKCGPVAAYEILGICSDRYEQLVAIEGAYYDYYGNGWEEKLLEQGQLCWMTRRLHEDGSPELWEIGMTQ